MNLAEQEPLQEELENLELWTRYIGQRTVELRNELVLKWLERDADGEPIDFSETGFKWNELGRLAQKF